jgi:phosphohistidine phosphatase
MKTLLILRHAKSSWKEDALPDHERPLNKRGRAEAPRMGKLLRKHDLLPDLILSSTAVRARSTVELVIEESLFDGETEFREDLYAFDSEPYLKALADLPDHYQRVMIVGHNPALEELLEELTDEYLPLPTAALAQVTLAVESWSEIESGSNGKLVDIWRPKEL